MVHQKSSPVWSLANNASVVQDNLWHFVRLLNVYVDIHLPRFMWLQTTVSQLCSIEYCSLKIFDRFVCICKKILFLIFLQKSGNVVASLWHNFCADIFANTIKSNRLTSMPVPELTGGGIMSIYLSLTKLINEASFSTSLGYSCNSVGPFFWTRCM